MREQTILWTRENIQDRIPNRRGCTARLANEDMVQDTGVNWLLTRNRIPHYFIEINELLDFVLKYSPKAKLRAEQNLTQWRG